MRRTDKADLEFFLKMVLLLVPFASSAIGTVLARSGR
jgi:hypothetical protein